MSITYIGHGYVRIETEGYFTPMRLSIDSLLKCEYGDYTKLFLTFAKGEWPIIFDAIKKSMSVCNCKSILQCTGINQKFRDIIGISFTNHNWCECLAIKVFSYCIAGNINYQINRLFPNDDQDLQYAGCKALLGELFILAQLGYPRALDTVTEKVQVDVTFGDVSKFVNELSDDSDIYFKSVIQLYKLTQVGKHTKSARTEP